MKISQWNSNRSEVNFELKTLPTLCFMCSNVILDYDFLFRWVFFNYLHTLFGKINRIPPHHIIWFSCTATVLQLQHESLVCTNITLRMVSSYVNSMLSWKKVMVCTVYTRSLEIWRIHIKPTLPFRTCNETNSSGNKVWEILNTLDKRKNYSARGSVGWSVAFGDCDFLNVPGSRP